MKKSFLLSPFFWMKSSRSASSFGEFKISWLEEKPESGAPGLWQRTENDEWSFAGRLSRDKEKVQEKSARPSDGIVVTLIEGTKKFKDGSSIWYENGLRRLYENAIYNQAKNIRYTGTVDSKEEWEDGTVSYPDGSSRRYERGKLVYVQKFKSVAGGIFDALSVIRFGDERF